MPSNRTRSRIAMQHIRVTAFTVTTDHTISTILTVTHQTTLDDESTCESSSAAPTRHLNTAESSPPTVTSHALLNVNDRPVMCGEWPMHVWDGACKSAAQGIKPAHTPLNHQTVISNTPSGGGEGGGDAAKTPTFGVIQG